MPDLSSPYTVIGATLRHRMLMRLRKLANQVTEEGRIDLVFLGRPALANSHWPVWAARKLPHVDTFLSDARGLELLA